MASFIFISSQSSAPWGGSEELWSQAAMRLRESGHRVAASVVHWPETHPKVSLLAEKGVDVTFQVPARGSLMWRAWSRFKRGGRFRWLGGKLPDLVVISQGSARDGLVWLNFCRKAGLPFAPIVHCNAEFWWPQDDLAGAMAGVYQAAAKVFCVSRHNLELLERQIGEPLPNAQVVRNPYNVSPDGKPGWPKENGVWRLACVARLEPAAKGQDLFLQVMSQPAWRQRPVEVNLYGAGACEEGLRRLAQHLQLTAVRFRGHVPNVEAIWQENHLLVLPSRYEGLPIALVEAMWCARPAVVTDTGGNAELCFDGETGFVAPAPAVSLLDAALERAWRRRNDWPAMGRAARARAEQLIPRDPVGEFCQRLLGCAALNSKTLPHG